jgi:Protein of unknown function (DUF4231)
MDSQTYLKDRVDDQLGWYDRKNSALKKRYRLMKGVTIVLGAAIPVLIMLSDSMGNAYKYAAAICGALVTVLEGISGMLKDKDVMTTYRSAREGLMREKIRYQTSSGIYQGLDDALAFRTFVDQCEGIMSAENQQWREQVQTTNSEKDRSS